MLGIAPGLRKLQPQMPKLFARKADAGPAGHKGPLFVGLLNGLMPCGPLQAMQILALAAGASGKPWAGGISMLMFSLGTVPLMLGLGSAVSALGKKYTRKVMTAGALLVVVLGLSMLTQGFSLAGSAHTSPIEANRPYGPETGEGQPKTPDEVQLVYSTLAPNKYPNISVQAGIPVKWIIDAPQGSINGCNNRMFIDEYGIEYTFAPGENIIEFTPENTGEFQYTCWMGMMRAVITVTEADAT
jgi:hypothetical protein